MTRRGFEAGDLWRVTRPGAAIHINVHLSKGAYSGTKLPLQVGQVLECVGRRYSGGSDGIPVTAWKLTPDLRHAAEQNLADFLQGGHLADWGEVTPESWGIPSREYLEVVEFDRQGVRITDPTMDETGRVAVDPHEYYGL